MKHVAFFNNFNNTLFEIKMRRLLESGAMDEQDVRDLELIHRQQKKKFSELISSRESAVYPNNK